MYVSTVNTYTPTYVYRFTYLLHGQPITSIIIRQILFHYYVMIPPPSPQSYKFFILLVQYVFENYYPYCVITNKKHYVHHVCHCTSQKQAATARVLQQARKCTSC